MKKYNIPALVKKLIFRKVIILDLMGTIMDGGGLYPVIKRKGLDEFFARHPDCYFALSTDFGSLPTKEESLKEIGQYLDALGIKDNISKIYYGWDMSGELKDLERIAGDFHTNIGSLVLIGDGLRDEESAKHYGVRFIKVPPISRDTEKVRKPAHPKTFSEDYENAPDRFSFENLEI
jgi:hypothetical protein